MNKIIKLGIDILSNPTIVLLLILGTSLTALSVAYISQFVFGLEPCIMCLYQRIPFAAAILLSGLGLILRKKGRAPLFFIALGIPTFLTNAALAFYHTGIEQHWWRSAVEGCAVHFGDEDTGTKGLLEAIMKAPTGRCDEIPWSDPILGLSMANYNIALSLDMALLCVLSLIAIRVRTR